MTNIVKKHEIPIKRRLASEAECKIDLLNDLPIIFKAFSEAVSAYSHEIRQTPPEARSRGFEASLLNSKMIQSIQSNFPLNWKFGRYKRFTLRLKGYLVLFKKLNKHNLPMNIQTKSVAAISNQLTLSLFDENTYVAEPILFFGYKKDKFGNIVDPKLVYIDEDHLRWTINADDLKSTTLPIAKVRTEPATPSIKPLVKKKKASNE